MHRLLLLAKIKEKKVYFGKLVTFWGKEGQFIPYLPPRPPRRCLYGVTCSKIFQEGGSAQISSLREGVKPPRTPLRTSMAEAISTLAQLTHGLFDDFFELLGMAATDF